MANYAVLKSAIQSVIKQNGNNEITGSILQQTLISVVNSFGSGYQFIGIATPATNPGTPDQKVFYIGSPGTYPNFGPAVIPDGNVGVFYYDSNWHYGSVAFPLGDNSVSTSKIQDGAITLAKLAQSLKSELLSSGYKYAGIATPTTNPGTPDQNVFYLASTAGTYTNFGGLTVENETAVLKYNGTWTLEYTGIKFVTVTQNTETGHTDISVGGVTTPVTSVEEVSQLSQNEKRIFKLFFKDIVRDKVFLNLDVVGGTPALYDFSGWSCIKIRVKSGERFDVSTYVQDAKAWALTDNDNKVLSYSTNTDTLQNPDIVTANQDGYLCVNLLHTSDERKDKFYIYFVNRISPVGEYLNDDILRMVQTGYKYAGIATPTTNPGTPGQNVFYLASTTGTYTNFGGLVLDDGEIAILKYNGAWSKDSTGAASLEKVNQLDQNIALLTCSTVSSTAAKTVSATGFALVTGGAFKVKFTYANTTSSPTLNINSTGAKAIVYNGAAAGADNSWSAGEVVEFYYDPTYNNNAGGFIGRSTVIRVLQNTETGHTDISVGGVTTPVASVEEVSQLSQKLIKIFDFRLSSESWADVPVDAIVYNVTAKLLSKKIAESAYVTVPYYDGAIYTYRNDLYIWDGDNLMLLNNLNRLYNKDLILDKFWSGSIGDVPTLNSLLGFGCCRIKVKSGEIYKVSSAGGGASIWMLADNEQKVLSVSSNSDTLKTPDTVTVSQDGYLFVNFYKGGSGQPNVSRFYISLENRISPQGEFLFEDILTKIDNINDSVDKKVNVLTGINLHNPDAGSVYGRRLDESGAEVSTSVTLWHVTDYIEVPNGITLYSSYIYSNAYAALYDENKTLISQSVTNSGILQFVTGAKYARFTVDRNACVSYNKKEFLPYTPVSKYVEDYLPLRKEYIKNCSPLSLSMIRTMGVCGDSYCSGTIFNGSTLVGEIESLSFGKIIERMSGIDVSIFAQGGSNTENWQIRQSCLPALLADTPKDVYLIALGINDASTVTLGTIADIKEDYQDNPNTYYGNYGRIIDQIKAFAPNAVIVLSKVLCPRTGSGGYYNYCSNAVVEIAAHYNIPYLETENDDFLMSDWYYNNIQSNGGHPTAIGYSGIAKSVTDLMELSLYNNSIWEHFNP